MSSACLISPLPTPPLCSPPPRVGRGRVAHRGCSPRHTTGAGGGDRHSADDRGYASLGFRTRGHCGVPYDQLTNSPICPWTLDFHVDYDTSVFESRFLVPTFPDHAL